MKIRLVEKKETIDLYVNNEHIAIFNNVNVKIVKLESGDLYDLCDRAGHLITWFSNADTEYIPFEKGVNNANE